MTNKYDNVYINEVSTVSGPYEANGPFSKLYDRSYSDFYFGERTFEQAESKLIDDAVDILLNKIDKTRFQIDLHISGDLMNQLVSSNYAASRLGIPFLGVYSACASSVEGLIIGANMIEHKVCNNVICTVSSHNTAAEKTFRYPVEYGGPKPRYTTFTTTGGCAAYLTRDCSGVKVDSSTIGTVTDMGIKDVYNMGAVMACACGDTIYKHLVNTKREVGYYDLILSGDLGIYGKKILVEYMKTEYNIDLKNYDDAASMIFDIDNQPVYAGGSGPACLTLVSYSSIFNKMKNGELRRVLLVATGALMNTSMVNQKLSIPSVAHAISLEAIK
jgi:stage V sporulation protein AD